MNGFLRHLARPLVARLADWVSKDGTCTFECLTINDTELYIRIVDALGGRWTLGHSPEEFRAIGREMINMADEAEAASVVENQ